MQSVNDSTLAMTRLLIESVTDQESGCWRWTGAKTPTGYGTVWWEDRSWFVHRLAYAAAIEPIPDGLVIDHVATRGCRHRDCFNPRHLEPVTQRENVARGSVGGVGDGA